jgi:type II secretion system protein H
MNTRKKAFTLIEMLVVIGVIAVVATIVIVAFAPFFRGKSLDTAAARIKTTVLAARTYAVNYRTTVKLLRPVETALRLYDLADVPRAEVVNLPRNITIDTITLPWYFTPTGSMRVGTNDAAGETNTTVVLKAPAGDTKTVYLFWASCMVYTED